MCKYLQVLIIVGVAQFHATEVLAQEPRERVVHGVWRSLPSAPGGGLFAERLALWRSGRLWHMLTAEDSYLQVSKEVAPPLEPKKENERGCSAFVLPRISRIEEDYTDKMVLIYQVSGSPKW